MSYILKNTSGLINTRLTDVGRRKLSQGSFNIRYFQIGDSEISYNSLPNTYNQVNTNILSPNFNSQNSNGAPQSNKQYIKYPYYVDGNSGSTYGIPFMSSVVNPVYNRAAMRGFFTGDTTATTITWSALTNNEYVVNSNYVIDMSTLNGSSVVTLIYSGCNTDIVRLPAVGDFITIFYDGSGLNNCTCIDTPTPTPTTSMFVSPTPSPSSTNSLPCDTPLPTPTPSPSYCTPTPPVNPCSGDAEPPCYMFMSSCYPILTYRIVSICNDQYTLDRNVLSSYDSCYARVLIYPPTMQSLYDSVTPYAHWNSDVINFESVCYTDMFDVKVWNMNIPWSENPAGLDELDYKAYSDFGSIAYMGSKEYFGYMSSSGQTDTGSVYYYNSFGDKITVLPKEQKAIAIVHYTNQSIDFFYGEKFAFEPYDSLNPENTVGQARNFKVHIPWIMWHKNPLCCYGQTFWVDPPGFDELELFQVYYIKSTKNSDMNVPGMRYYYLWDTNANSSDGYPNRVGKVFPDQQIVIFDDEEIVAALSYKSNRNWTLPAPKISLVSPNTCGNEGQEAVGILTGNSEYLYVTYLLSTTTGNFTDSMHCNYYSKIQGPNTDCLPVTSQNVGVRFGGEFGCLTQCDETCGVVQGFVADTIHLICQKVTSDARPDSSEWKMIDVTSQLSLTTINGFLTQSGLTGNTFVITQEDYDNAPFYSLGDIINLTPKGSTDTQLNFGDEYYFYGSIETDIQATIYEMNYKVNLGQAEFLATTNPTWTQGSTSYITEIGLYDSSKNLMIISKLQSPVVRQGLQQFSIKFDF